MLSVAACAPKQWILDRDVELPTDAPLDWTARPLTDATPVAESWPSEFGDPKLAALVDEALRHSPNLKSAWARLAEAAAVSRIAGAELLPQVTGGLRASRSQNVLDGSSGAVLPPGTSGPLTTRASNYGVSLDMTWELDVWGRVRAGADASMADFEAAMAAFEGARLSLASQVAKAYIASVAAKLQSHIATASLRDAESLLERVRDRYRSGLVSAVDLKLAEGLLETTRGRLAATERLRDAGLRQLEILVGRYPAADVDLADALPSFPAQVPGGLPSELISRRPDLTEAERRYVASLSRVEQAKAARYPRFALTASVGTSSGEAKNLLNGDFAVWSLAANLTAPIFDGGRLGAAKNAAEAREAQALQEFVQKVLVALGEVESSLAADHWLADEASANQRAAEASADASQLSAQRYSAGLGDVLAVIRARQELFAARAQETAARSERLLARVNLYVALGGGFDAQAVSEIEIKHNLLDAAATSRQDSDSATSTTKPLDERRGASE